MTQAERADRPEEAPAEPPARQPAHDRTSDRASDDDSYCWVCGGPVSKRHCKIVCLRCGFMRDCSDP